MRPVLPSWIKIHVGYEEGVVGARGQRLLVAGAERLELELRCRPDGIEPSAAASAPAVGRVCQLQIAGARGRRTGRRELLALKVPAAVYRFQPEQCAHLLGSEPTVGPMEGNGVNGLRQGLVGVDGKHERGLKPGERDSHSAVEERLVLVDALPGLGSIATRPRGGMK